MPIVITSQRNHNLRVISVRFTISIGRYAPFCMKCPVAFVSRRLCGRQEKRERRDTKRGRRDAKRRRRDIKSQLNYYELFSSTKFNIPCLFIAFCFAKFNINFITSIFFFD